MHEASLTLDPAFRIGEVDPRLFGSFVEHMGRCVYTGIYEPDHPTADAAGFRERRRWTSSASSASPLVRYPGGNFVSGYRWEDGVGPRRRAAPPARPGLALDRDQPVRRSTSSSTGRAAPASSR